MLEFILKITENNSYNFEFEKNIKINNFFHYVTVKPFCKPGQVKVYGVAKHEKIHVSCEVLANPKEGGFESSSNGYETNGLKFDWVFNSSSEKIDLPQDRIEVVGSRSLAEHVPKVD